MNMADDITNEPTNSESGTPDPKPAKKASKKIVIDSSFTKDPEVHQVVKEALTSFIKKQSEVNRSQKEVDALIATCQEFMKSFVIFGYTFEGEPMSPIFCAHNQMEADALSTYLTKFFNANIKMM